MVSEKTQAQLKNKEPGSIDKTGKYLGKRKDIQYLIGFNFFDV